MSGAVALAFATWWLLIWPDTSTCEVVYAKYPEATTAAQSITNLKACQSLAKSFTDRGQPAVCDTSFGLTVRCAFGSNGQCIPYTAMSASRKGSIFYLHPYQLGDKICVFRPYTGAQ